MVIKIYRSSFGGWMPTCEMWKKHRHILYPLCIGGNIAYKTREGIIEFFASHNITAIEEGSVDDMADAEQLLMF